MTRVLCKLRLKCTWFEEALPKGQCCYDDPTWQAMHYHKCIDAKKRTCIYCNKGQMLQLDTMGYPPGEYYWATISPRTPLLPVARSLLDNHHQTP